MLEGMSHIHRPELIRSKIGYVVTKDTFWLILFCTLAMQDPIWIFYKNVWKNVAVILRNMLHNREEDYSSRYGTVSSVMDIGWCSPHFNVVHSKEKNHLPPALSASRTLEQTCYYTAWSLSAEFTCCYCSVWPKWSILKLKDHKGYAFSLLTLFSTVRRLCFAIFFVLFFFV